MANDRGAIVPRGGRRVSETVKMHKKRFIHLGTLPIRITASTRLTRARMPNARDADRSPPLAACSTHCCKVSRSTTGWPRSLQTIFRASLRPAQKQISPECQTKPQSSRDSRVQIVSQPTFLVIGQRHQVLKRRHCAFWCEVNSLGFVRRGRRE